MAYEHERDEWRNAVRHNPNQPCLSHNMQPNLLGGGTCTHCGESVDREEAEWAKLRAERELDGDR